MISNDDTRGIYRDIASLDEWRALGHERADDGSSLGFVGDAGLASLAAFDPPRADAPSAPVEDLARVDLAPDSPCRGRAIDVRTLLTLRAPIAVLPVDARGRLAAQRDLGAVQGD